MTLLIQGKLRKFSWMNKTSEHEQCDGRSQVILKCSLSHCVCFKSLRKEGRKEHEEGKKMKYEFPKFHMELWMIISRSIIINSGSKLTHIPRYVIPYGTMV
jgi:hypothetical protein